MFERKRCANAFFLQNFDLSPNHGEKMRVLFFFPLWVKISMVLETRLRNLLKSDTESHFEFLEQFPRAWNVLRWVPGGAGSHVAQYFQCSLPTNSQRLCTDQLPEKGISDERNDFPVFICSFVFLPKSSQLLIRCITKCRN